MRYVITDTDRDIIRESIKEYPIMSIFILMDRLKCSAHKAWFIVENYIPTIQN